MNPIQILKDASKVSKYYGVRPYVRQAFLNSFELIESLVMEGTYTKDKAITSLLTLYKPFGNIEFTQFYFTNASKVINSIQDAEKTAERIGGQEGKDRFIAGILSIFNVRKDDKIFDEVNEIMFNLSLMSKLGIWWLEEHSLLLWLLEEHSLLYALPSQLDLWRRNV